MKRPIQLICAAAAAGLLAFASMSTADSKIKETNLMNDPKACDTACALPTDDAELRKLLTPEQYRIMKENGTERPFANEYWDNHADGIYVDRISGKPLFSSKDKFDSGTGWPSFTQPVAKGTLKEISDSSHGMTRTEIRSASSDSHLGHVFEDGPKPTGLRYCMNSASLRFVPVANLEKEGFGEFLPQFGKTPTAKTAATQEQKLATAIFAAGCFWGVEETFRQLEGVKSTSVGYTGGHVKDPNYKQVCTDTTGHAEAVKIEYDPAVVSYDKLLNVFWENHNPTQVNRQGPDYGTQYRTAIFFTTPEQEKEAKASKEALAKSGKWTNPIATQIVPAVEFYPAEDYHQQYLAKRGLAACHN